MYGKILNMKKVITYGTFDLLHYGHINVLKRAKKMGDYLIVGLSTDEFNKIKGKKSYQSFAERKAVLDAVVYVDEIIPECEWDQKVKDIKRHNVQVFTMGSDWEGKFDDLPCEVKYIPRTKGISSTMLRAELMLKDQAGRAAVKSATQKNKEKMAELKAINKEKGKKTTK